MPELYLPVKEYRLPFGIKIGIAKENKDYLPKGVYISKCEERPKLPKGMYYPDEWPAARERLFKEREAASSNTCFSIDSIVESPHKSH